MNQTTGLLKGDWIVFCCGHSWMAEQLSILLPRTWSQVGRIAIALAFSWMAGNVSLIINKGSWVNRENFNSCIPVKKWPSNLKDPELLAAWTSGVTASWPRWRSWASVRPDSSSSYILPSGSWDWDGPWWKFQVYFILRLHIICFIVTPESHLSVACRYTVLHLRHAPPTNNESSKKLWQSSAGMTVWLQGLPLPNWILHLTPTWPLVLHESR